MPFTQAKLADIRGISCIHVGSGPKEQRVRHLLRVRARQVSKPHDGPQGNSRLRFRKASHAPRAIRDGRRTFKTCRSARTPPGVPPIYRSKLLQRTRFELRRQMRACAGKENLYRGFLRGLTGTSPASLPSRSTCSHDNEKAQPLNCLGAAQVLIMQRNTLSPDQDVS